MTAFSRPDRRILHISDTRLPINAAGDNIDCGESIARLRDQVEAIDGRPDALVCHGNPAPGRAQTW